MKRTDQSGVAVRLALTLALGATTAVVSTAVLVAHADIARAQQQARPPVRLEMRGVFGNEVLTTGAWQTLVVTAENRTREAFHGVVDVWQNRYDSAPLRYETRLDLPPRATRTVLVSVYVGDTGDLVAHYAVDGAELGTFNVSPAYASGARTAIVMSDPARLRGALLDLEVEQADIANRGAARNMRVPVGSVSFEGRSGDPLLPTDSVGWSSVALLAVSGPMLARIPAAERRALTDWLYAGGRMLVFPRTDADLQDPFLRSLVGDVGQLAGEPTVVNEQLVPRGARGQYLSGGRVHAEAFGGSAPVGFGRVYLAAYDGMAPPFVEAPETRELVRAILGARVTVGNDYPLLPFGATEERVGASWFGQGLNFGRLRAALDPNESYRPALVIAAILLLLYIIAVGPLNFAWVLKRNRPTLALLSTPIVAAACLAAMLLVGYFGKGVVMRFRRVELVEAVEGAALGPARRYTGFFLTRPLDFDLDAPARGVARQVLGGGGELPPVTENQGAGQKLRDLRGRLWDTVFVREDRLVELGHGVVFRRDGLTLTAVENHTPYPIRGAVVVDAASNVYRVGDIAPGGRATVSRNYDTSLSTGWDFENNAADGTAARLAPMLGLESGDRDAMLGTLALLNGTPVAAPMPAFFARIDMGRTRELAGAFANEQDLVFLRVVPTQPFEPVCPAGAASAGTPPPVGLPAEQAVEPQEDGQEPPTTDGGAAGAGADGGAP